MCAHNVFRALIFSACSMLYSCGILSRMRINFFEEKRQNLRSMRMASEPLDLTVVLNLCVGCDPFGVK